MTFALDPRLAADTFLVGDAPLCRVLLMNDARFPWAILVPRRPGLIEIHDLDASERAILIEEAALVGDRLKKLTGAFKINIAALGNSVPQLHVHVIARFADDSAWPGPVWGVGETLPYTPGAAEERLATLRAALGLGSA
jgi:diadenosine tetraphosphate (Ap4A) HIT family hydrolase